LSRLWPAFIIFLLALPHPARSADLIYPLDSPQSISSNYGQHRLGHPHAGLDLWTFLEIGAPVHAVADGVIFRIKCSPGGYGRVIYQRLTDGRVAVYGHLDRFAAPLAAAIEKRQRAAGTFRLHWMLNRTEAFRVAQGDIIGYAGDAGTDVAHLHFELRGADGRPVNPLLHGFPYRDTTAPTLAALHFQPLAADGMVQDALVESIVAFQPAGPGRFTAPPVRIAGRVGMSVEAYDRIDGSPRRLAPHDIRLRVDGRDLFAHRFATVGYPEGHISLLSYHQRLAATARRYFVRLHRLHERTRFHPTALTGSLADLAPGEHEAQIVVTDEGGRQADGTFTIVVADPQQVATHVPEPVASANTAASGTIITDTAAQWHGGFLELTGRLAAPARPRVSATLTPGNRRVEPSAMRLVVSQGRFALTVPVAQKRGGSVQLLFQDATTLTQQALSFDFTIASAGGVLKSADGRARLTIPAGALYAARPVAVQSRQLPVPSGLEPVGLAYDFGAPWEPLKSAVTVRLTPPPGASNAHMGVYLYDRGTWWYLGAGAQAKAPLLATYALLRDNGPPSLGEMFVDPGERPTIRLTLSDFGSGISAGAVSVTLDGKRQLVDYQPLKNQLRFSPPIDLAPGEHTVALHVTDRAGNAAAQTYSFVRKID
jgi:hypothetical protein